MIYGRLYGTFVGIVATLLDSMVVAEFAGYWLYRLLECDGIPAFGRSHLVRHGLIVGPRKPMRAEGHQDATEDRLSAAKLGIRRWLAPSALMLLFCWGAMALFGVRPVDQLLALCGLLAWSVLVFSYLRDGRIEDFRVTRVALFRIWFWMPGRIDDFHQRS